MTKRKTKTMPRGSSQPTQTTPRKGSKAKQRRIQKTESTTPTDGPEGLKQKKLVFAVTTSPETNDEVVKPPIISPQDTNFTTNSPIAENQKNDTPIEVPTKTHSTVRLLDCRYKITIEMLPTEDPLPAFCSGFRKTFELIQKICHPKQIWLAAWDPEQSSSFAPIKTPRDIPSGKKWTHRRQLSAYFGGYIDPNPKGEKMFSKLRFMSPSDSGLDLEQLGQMLRGAFYSLEPDLHVAIPQNPIPCQATRPTCIGWLFGSSKYINEKTFLPAMRSTLKIPEDCKIGMQWRAIVNSNGKRPNFDNPNSTPCALHLDVSDEYAPTISLRASELWCSRQSRPKKTHPRLPNDVQLRLVPCFSNSLTRARSDTSKADITQMAEKQHYFFETVLQKIEVPFIRLLDTELSPQESVTLRRIIMARAPAGSPTKRLVHNVDFNWNGSKVIITTPIRFLLETTNFANNLIPALRHDYGADIDKWFTAAGIQLFKDHTWDPESSTSSTRLEQATKAIADEDLWDLGDSWKKSTMNRPDLPNPEPMNQTSIPQNRSSCPPDFGDDSDIRSFASAFQRQSTSSPVTLPNTTKTAGTVHLSAETIHDLHNKNSTDDDDRDVLSMSTAAKTTESTRIKLQNAKGTIATQASELEQAKFAMLHKDTEIERLRQQLQTFLRQSESVEFHPERPAPHDMDDDDITAATNELIAALTKPPVIPEFPPPPPIENPIFHQPPETQRTPNSETRTEVDLTALPDETQETSSVSTDATSSAVSSSSSSTSSSSTSSATSAHSRLAAKELVDITHGDVGDSD